MKVEKISIDIVRRETPSTALNDHRGAIGGTLEHGVLRIVSDDGIEGDCLFSHPRLGTHDLPALIVEKIAGQIIGRDAADREWLWSQAVSDADWGPGLSAAWSCVDVALWDIAGKAARMPVHALLGTCRRQIPVYATYPPRQSTAEGYAAEAEELSRGGFTAYKIHPGAMAPNDVIRTVGMVRRAVGDTFELMLDPNHGYDFATALEIGRALDDNRFRWFEDPVPWNDSDSILKLSRDLTTPLAMSDAGPFLLKEAAAYVRIGAPRIIRGADTKARHYGTEKAVWSCRRI